LQLSVAYHVNAGNNCTNSTECLEGWEFCQKATDEVVGTCAHKAVWPLLPLEYVGFFVTFICIVGTNAGGLGGGGVMLPVLIVFFRFDLKRAIAMSNSTIAVSGFIRYLMNLGKPHPLKAPHGLLVDYDIGILMLPVIFLGVVVGSAFQKQAPVLLLLVSYVLLMVGIVSMNCAKIFQLVKEHKQVQVEEKELIEIDT